MFVGKKIFHYLVPLAELLKYIFKKCKLDFKIRISEIYKIGLDEKNKKSLSIKKTDTFLYPFFVKGI